MGKKSKELSNCTRWCWKLWIFCLS